MEGLLANVLNVSAVMNHLLAERGMSDDEVRAYAPEVVQELKRLSRSLFVEKFEETRGYKKNMEVLAFVRSEERRVGKEGTWKCSESRPKKKTASAERQAYAAR